MITNYTELQSAVTNWLDRSDLALRVPEFIALAEAEIKRVIRVEAAFSPITLGAPTSTLLTEAPDIYLYGALKHAAPYLEHDERIATWETLFRDAVASYNEYKRTAAAGTAITTYTVLLSAVDNWLNRSDLTARVPQFISLADAEIARRLRRTVVRAPLSTSTQATTVPTQASEVRMLRYNNESPALSHRLDLVTPVMLADLRPKYTTAGRPRYYTVDAGQMTFERVPDQTYVFEVTYYLKHVALGPSNPNNVTLAESPDLYLFGALKAAAPYLSRDDRVPQWKGEFEEKLLQLNQLREQEELGSDMKSIRLPVVF